MDRSGATLFGWKIAATSLAGQKHINVDGPMAGRLLAEKAVEVGGVVSLATSKMRVAEIEFAFRFGRQLPPRPSPYEIAEVMDAVASLHPAIEIPDSRYDDFCAVGAPQLIADNALSSARLRTTIGVPWTSQSIRWSVSFPASRGTTDRARLCWATLVLRSHGSSMNCQVSA